MVSSIAHTASVVTHETLFSLRQQTATEATAAATVGAKVAQAQRPRGLYAGLQELNSNALGVLLQNQQAGAAQAGGSPYRQGSFQDDFRALIHALRSGDLDAAKQAFSTLSQLNSGDNGVSFDSIGVPASVQQVVGQIGSSLANDDLAGAQAATDPAQGEPPDSYQDGSFQDRFQSLAQAVQSGDLTAARQAYSTISLLNTGHNGISFDSIGVSAPLQQTLQQIGSSLDSFDIGSAQQQLLSYTNA